MTRYSSGGLHILMPLVIYGAAHTGKQISVIFQKKQYPAYGHTITGNFFEKNFILEKFFLGFY